jgi:hypothetical protein
MRTSRTLSGFGSGALVALALTSCNSLLGIPEVELRDDAGASEASASEAASEAGDVSIGDDGGTVACSADQKACDGKCVSRAEPATGCGNPGCAPCPFAHASVTCEGEACVMGACQKGFDDCNGKPEDGCEADVLNGINSCGGCGNVCAPDFGCSNEVCFCTTDASCGAGGACRQGFCICNGTRCREEDTCDVNGDCP